MGLVQIVIDDSTSKAITGTYEFDRENGGTFIGGAGTVFPGIPEDGEWFWRTDESKLYRYNGTSWDAVAADVVTHASTHENGGSDEISVAGLSGVLADDQPAQVHALGGAKHSADTLANLNANISDATLDDVNSPRDPTSHAANHENGGSDEVPHQTLNGAGTNTHAQLDSHVASVANPHAVTKTQVGLGNVTDDAQLKRAASDFDTFTEKTSPVSADLLLIEDSAAAGTKKRVQVGNLPGGSAGISEILTSEVNAYRSTTSTSWVSISGASITFTPSAGERVLIIASMQQAISASGVSNRGFFDVAHNNSGSYVRLGGARGLAYMESAQADWDCPMNIMAALQFLNAVSTTVKLKWARQGSGTLFSRGQDCPIRLQIVRF